MRFVTGPEWNTGLFGAGSRRAQDLSDRTEIVAKDEVTYAKASATEGEVTYAKASATEGSQLR